jgi:hypothetical protein
MLINNIDKLRHAINFKVLFNPFFFYNSLSWIVGSIWLIFLGQWDAIGITLFFVFGGPLGYSFLLMPVALVGLAGLTWHERGGLIRIISLFLLLTAFLSTFILITISTLSIFYGFFKKSDSTSLIPMMLVAYGSATSPWIYIAQKEYKGGNPISMITVMFLSLSSAVVFVCIAFLQFNIFNAFGIIVITMTLVFFGQLFLIIKRVIYQ